ncbi:MAG: hypothetical protein JF592_18410 [Microbacterium sp.]|uniref:hypothetical protein n=1 Tax=Microbacterium sp. TaxID=51671 RepID=UPI001E08821E|nr:hypothetical protein [Microbacterium sp.]MBW8764522.1 hypothetical protein [Microbacterium sp.]
MAEVYDAIARRGGKWWIIDVPALDSVTQARHVHEIEKQARGLVAAVLNLEESEVRVSVEIQLPEAIAEQWAEAESLLSQAGDVSRRAAVLRRKVVRDLIEQEQLSQAEAGALLKLSTSRVQQLLAQGEA